MRILVVSSSRADWSYLSPIVTALRENESFLVKILATGQHLSDQGDSLSVITQDVNNVDFKVDMELSDDDRLVSIAKSMGQATAGTAEVIDIFKPDLIILLGDRYEILSIALSAVVARVPIAHVFGGDITEGAIDDVIRHAITKLSSIHFPSNAISAARIIQMGENPCRVHNVGSTSIDHISKIKKLSRSTFFKSVGLAPQKSNFLITMHPTTLSQDSLLQVTELLLALEKFPEAGLIFTGSNADPGAREIDIMLKNYSDKREHSIFCFNLGSRRFFSALEHCDIIIGNSSSGILEAPTFKLPTVNIGERQLGRLRAKSVVDCAPLHTNIVDAIKKALKLDCSKVENPYGDGDASRKIRDILAVIENPRTLLSKSFRDASA